MDISTSSGPEHSRRPRARAGFTLVEVTLAVGIFAFALTAIFGLIPLGLSSFRQAMDASTGSQIFQRVLNDAQQTDFDVLTSGAVNSTPVVLATRYFDNEGNAVATPAAALYHVNTVVIAITGLPGNATFSHLATVNVQVATNPGNRTIVRNATTSLWQDPSVTISSYSGFVSRNQ